ncbi:pyrimidine reductase family protein [Spongiactinospora sp. TRM90649]|nr:pyrimidine reductase family protein [Spongiactinospora sp. TRM90649]MDF5757892.1 pyrimidine reductase family protein [Spongiactinospora sp. TRM90649]
MPTAYAYPDRPWLRVNMVASADGAAWTEGRSGGLSGPPDKRAFQVLRGLADVILAGAATVRAEGYGPVAPRESWRESRAGRPPTPPIAVVTRGLDLDLGGDFFAGSPGTARPIVITCEAAPLDRRQAASAVADVVVAGGDRVEMGRAVAALRERGHDRILCEGGPRLNAQLAADGLIDELCLTVSPLLLGGGAARVLDGPAGRTPLRLADVLEEDGFLFTRYVREES